MSPAIASGDYEWIRLFVRAHCGHDIGADRHHLVELHLGPVATEYGLPGAGELIRRLRREDPSDPMTRRVIRAFAPDPVPFFRDRDALDALRNHLLPALGRSTFGRTLRIWCTAASTGQQPYSLAMMLHSALPELAPRTRILCTDVSAAALARAKSGVYSHAEVARGLPPNELMRYFEPEGSQWRAIDELRDMLTTRVLSLAVPWVGVPPQDVALLPDLRSCADRSTKAGMLERMRETLVPGGYMLLQSPDEVVDAPGWVVGTFGATTVHQRVD